MSPRRYPDGLETRAALELRAAPGRRLEGYGAVFNTPAKVGDFTESIRAGAFAASLAADADILCLVDHDPCRLLARTASETLRLREDGRGLWFDCDLPSTTLASDVLELARRGDLGGASIGFRAVNEAWPARDRRELRAVTLIEVSIITAWPAYGSTSVQARSRGVCDVGRAMRRRFLDLL